MKILVINGPNLNMLGIREPAMYGHDTYKSLVSAIKTWADEFGCEVKCFQSNHEGAIIDEIQKAFNACDGIVINAGGYTHTSIGILDALKAVALPTVEVHITDISAREPFRSISYVGMACEARFIGMGFEGYKKALEYLCKKYSHG